MKKMMSSFVHAVIIGSAILVFAAMPAVAGQDNDLDMIPDTVMSAPTPDASKPPAESEKPYRIRFYADQALQGNFRRDDLRVPLPADNFAGWNNRLSFDLRAESRLSSRVSATIADRFDHFFDEDTGPDSARIRNDLKEAYLSLNFFQSDYLDVGRINVRNGVALGFNPTDFFKKNAVSTRISEDPGVLRENRLGTLMLRGQIIRERGALTVAAAPRVSDKPDQWWTDQGSAGLALNRTNSENRFLAKLTVRVWEDLSPELLYYHEQGANPGIGFNITKGIGDNIVAYLEWSGSKRKELIADALGAAADSGLFPAYMSAVMAVDGEERFRNQAAMGFSFTEKNANRTTYLEYHYNQAGFSENDWKRWFEAGSSGSLPNAGLAQARLGQLWFIRQWAQEVQEPANRHYLFVRTTWEDAIIRKLNLTGIVNINLSDGSFFVQPLAEYHFGDHTTFSLTLNLYAGRNDSEFGSLQQQANVKAGVAYYF